MSWVLIIYTYSYRPFDVINSCLSRLVVILATIPEGLGKLFLTSNKHLTSKTEVLASHEQTPFQSLPRPYRLNA